MRPILTHLAIAAFSLHILLGCCWHHAHGAGCPPGHFHGAQAYDHVHLPDGSILYQHGACDHHDSSESPEPPTNSHDSCTDPSCVYLHAVAVTFNVAPQPVSLVALLADGLSCHDAQLLTGVWDDRGKFPPHVAKHITIEHFLN